MSSPGTPQHVADEVTNVGGIPVNRVQLHSWLRIFLIVSVCALTVWDIVSYSYIQAQRSELDALQHRFDRLEQMMLDTLATSQGQGQLEKIQQRVVGIESSVDDLKDNLEDPDPSP
jgi:cell division protein FtsB